MSANGPLRLALAVPILLWAGWLPAACGYQWVGSPTDLAPGPNLRIDLFMNATHEERLGEILTEAFRNEVIHRSYFHLATGEDADSRIQGRVRSIKWTPVVYDASGGVLRYEVALEVSAEWLDTYDTPLGKAVGRRTLEFAASPNPVMNESGRREAATRLATILAETLMDDLIQGF